MGRKKKPAPPFSFEYQGKYYRSVPVINGCTNCAFNTAINETDYIDCDDTPAGLDGEMACGVGWIYEEVEDELYIDMLKMEQEVYAKLEKRRKRKATTK